MEGKSQELAKDFVYDRSLFRRLMKEGELSRDVAPVHHVFGVDCTRINNIYMLDAHTALCVAGNVLHMLGAPRSRPPPAASRRGSAPHA